MKRLPFWRFGRPFSRNRIQGKKMQAAIDLEAFLTPISGENPAGEDLRYTPVYDELREARRADDVMEQGDWKTELKVSDWDRVIATATDALMKKTKDLQIGVWLTEALIKKEGFDGFAAGLEMLTGFLKNYWDHLYPVIEDGDLEFRIAPIEFMNERLSASLREVPLTDPRATVGHSWFKWQESRQVGYDAETRNQYGDVDETKKRTRDERIAEGKLTAEDFDSAVALSSGTWYVTLAESLTRCRKAMMTFDQTVDERFGSNAPRLADMRDALEDCERFVTKTLKDKKVRVASSDEEKKETEPSPGEERETGESPAGPVPKPKGRFLSKLFGKEAVRKEKAVVPRDDPPMSQPGEVGEKHEAAPPLTAAREERSPVPAFSFQPLQTLDSDSLERAVWEKALETLEASGIQEALGQLLNASYGAPSVRERNRYRLLMAKLCLMAERPDLARPIVEEVYALTEELHLERWESPLWIAELLGTLYLCLTSGESSDEDTQKAKLLFRRLCTTDVTKA
ncbi:MAG: type VI secretion system protein TssA, partial [Deltaproteobacteria bacterium]